jgi:hypothetical protein
MTVWGSSDIADRCVVATAQSSYRSLLIAPLPACLRDGGRATVAQSRCARPQRHEVSDCRAPEAW